MTHSAAGPTLAHRSVSSIRSGAGHSSSLAGQTGPTSPHTPVRGPTTLAFSSPSSLRADEETLVIELGCRYLRLGFAGESAPKATLRTGPDEQRRLGDFTRWVPQEIGQPSSPWPSGPSWSSCHEFWSLGRPNSHLGLVSDKLERAIRDAFSHYLLIDSRPRRMCLVLPPAAPLPLLSTVLDTLFSQFQAPTVSLVSSPVMAAIGAGVRSALVVDIGWAETVVSSVYEYREIRHSRSIRGGRMLVCEVHDILASVLSPPKEGNSTASSTKQLLSFEECEDIACRLVWSRQMSTSSSTGTLGPLSTVQEQDETAPEPIEAAFGSSDVQISLSSCDGSPRTIKLPFRRLSEPCEQTFVSQEYSRVSFDDEESPLPQLIYEHLLALPVDARASCMSRIVFVGGCSGIPGLKRRLYDEVGQLIQTRGWDVVQGRGADKVRARTKISQPVNTEGDHAQLVGADVMGGVEVIQENDPVHRMLHRDDQAYGSIGRRLRAVESLGSWTGASLAIQLKNVAIASIERDSWLLQGAQGASKPGDVDMKAQQRQSLGPGLMRGASGSANWTLGAWGAT